MSNFWPTGLSVSDVQSPYEVLESAREEWETASEGVFTLVLQQTESEDGNAIITVHAKHLPSNRTATLLSVIHRLNEPYPITIETKENSLPNILKKSYYQFGMDDIVGWEDSVFPGMPDKGKIVKNKWVSDTPSEFRKKLAEAFNLSVIKATVLRLTSGPQR